MRIIHDNGREIFYSDDRSEWRQWLNDNFETAEDIWFAMPLKDSDKPGIIYNDAVEEALCFGWVDSIAGTTEGFNLRRFTPRRKGSTFSRPNIERLIWLDSQGMIHPSVRPDVEKLITTEYVFPKDIIRAIKKDEVAWDNFQSYSDSYKRIRVAYIDAARNRPEEFQKRLKNFIDKTRQNKIIIGHGGVAKYY